MDLHGIEQVLPANLLDRNLSSWRAGDAWLGGGTWLFSTEQPALRRLHDLMAIPIGSPIAELQQHTIAHNDWRAASLIGKCCDSFLAGFKIWNAATVGGNICMSLPAGPMIALCVALDGTYTLRSCGGEVRKVAALDFTIGDHDSILAPGELLQIIELPAAGLRRRVAMRRFSLVKDGRSSVLVIGSHDTDTGAFALTVTAATSRPVQLRFDKLPEKQQLRYSLASKIDPRLWFDDPNGTPDHRRHLTTFFAEDVVKVLS